MTIYIILLIVIPAIWIFYELGLVARDKKQGKGTTTADKNTRLFNFLAITLGLVLAAALSFIPFGVFKGGKTPLIFFIGMGILLLGMGLRYWAVATLGKAFRTTIETDAEQQVINSGPYHLIRHPSYAGWLLICIGYGVAVQNWLSLAVAVLLPLAALLYRISIEEKVLVSVFGQRYLSYQEHTKRLVPWVW